MSNSSERHYEVVKKAIIYLKAQSHHQPSLSELAQQVNMSEHHLQRVFTQWAGISPKRFIQSLTKERALEALRHSDNLADVAWSVGLSGTGRLHDLIVTCEAVTPGEVKNLGHDLVIRYGVADTPFGPAFVGWTDRGICFLQFVEDNESFLLALLKQQWPLATLIEADASAQSEAIFATVPDSNKPIHLMVKGTNFQLKVWEALLNSSTGQLLSYAQLAQRVGSPKASRAVGSAVAANNIGFLIPCHRVIRGDGDVGQFRWGSERKVAIQAWEACR